MAKKAKKDNKSMIVGGVCIALVALIAIVAAVIMLNSGDKVNDKYFVSDDSKYVLTLSADEMGYGESEETYVPVNLHMVYTYSGDEITGLKIYTEYKDNTTAKAALEEARADGNDVSNYVVDGKYVVETASASQYEGITASDVKQQLEFLESVRNMTPEETGESDGAIEEEIVEAEEVVEE